MSKYVIIKNDTANDTCQYYASSMDHSIILYEFSSLNACVLQWNDDNPSNPIYQVYKVYPQYGCILTTSPNKPNGINTFSNSQECNQYIDNRSIIGNTVSCYNKNNMNVCG